ncbi:MAG: DNA alkylation repair protein [Roseiflexaceae bacterium]
MSDPPIEALLQQLGQLSNPATRDWWQRYLKGAIPFRGVAMGQIRVAIHQWADQQQFAAWPLAEQKAAALSLFAQPYAEDKLVGVLLLHERLGSQLGLADLDHFAMLFDNGLIADWNSCDWFCVKVLGGMLAQAEDPRPLAEAISAWRSAPTLWQRRAVLVAFVNHAPRGEPFFNGFTALALENCAAIVGDPQRFAQTGIGWLLRELSRAEPLAVIGFVQQYGRQLSREALRMATARLTSEQQTQLRQAFGAGSASRRAR